MADSTRNVFDVLEDDLDEGLQTTDAASKEEEKSDPAVSETGVAGTSLSLDGADSTAASDGAESQNWTDVSRTRRLVPKYSLSKEVMGLENTRNRGSTPSAVSTPVGADAKKKVIRFSREEILSLRKPSKALPELLSLGDILFSGQQEPECFKKLDADEVYRLWHASPENKSRTGADAGRGRGRGRGRSLEGDDQNSSDWTRGAVAKGVDSWDDIGVGGKIDNGLDLADFSAATLKFRTEMGDFGKDENIELYDSNDVMEGLFREQRAAELISNDIEEDESRPEWADVDIHASAPQIGFFSDSVQSAPQTTNAGGRAILNALLPSAHSSSDVITNQRAESNSELDYTLGMRAVDAGRGTVHGDEVSALSPGLSAPLSPMTRGVSACDVTEATVVPPIPSLDDALWMYLDPRNRPQGPFSTSSMRQWMVDGYFAPTLPIKLTHWSDFHPLYSVYLDAMSAFQVVPAEPTTGGSNALQSAGPLHPVDEGCRSSQAEYQDLAPKSILSAPQPIEKVEPILKNESASQKTTQQIVESKKKDKAPKPSKGEPAATEAAVPRDSYDGKKKKDVKAVWGKPENADSTGKSLSEIQAEEKKSQNTSAARLPGSSDQPKTKSSQLKSLLGLPASPLKDTSEAKSISAAPSWAGSNAAPRASSGSKSLKEIQDEEEKARRQQEVLARDKASASIALSVQAAPKWKIGSTAAKTVQPVHSPSLTEIMQQEEKARQGGDPTESNSTRAGTKPAAASSWAAKASKISTGGSYNAVPVSPVTRVPGAEVAASGKGAAVSSTTQVANVSSSSKKVDEVESFWNFSESDAKSAVPAPNVSQGTAPTKKQSVKNDFGGSGMPAAMSEWCASQLAKLKKSNDLTLIQFCYTLQSPVEIREYFAEYLGSTPQVSQFATEFIQRKEGKAVNASNSGIPSTASNAGFQSATKKKKAKPPK